MQLFFGYVSLGVVMKKYSVFHNALFNSAGAIIYSICQWAITMSAVRASGDFENSGILQLAISVTNIFFVVATYVPRTFQISDLDEEYSPGEYVGIRIVSSLAAFVLCIFYSAVFGYSDKKLACITVYMLFKLTEAFSDVYRAYAQINYRMDYEFVSYLLRGIVSVLSFDALLACTGNIFLAIAGMLLSSTVVVVFYDLNVAKKFARVNPQINKTAILKAGKACFPVVAASVIITLYATIPRQFLEKLHGSEALGSYASVATPIVIVQLLASSLFNPMLTRFAELYKNKDIAGIRSFFVCTFSMLAGLTAIALIGAKLIGEYIYVLLYGEKIKPYCGLMYAVIISSAMCAMCWLLNSILIILRQQHAQIISSITGIVVVLTFSSNLISNYAMNGVSYTILFGYFICMVMSAVFIIRDLHFMKSKG